MPKKKLTEKEIELKAMQEAKEAADLEAKEKAKKEADEAKAEADKKAAEEKELQAALDAEESLKKAEKAAEAEKAKSEAKKTKKITASELEIVSSIDLKFGKDLWLRKEESIFISKDAFENLLAKLPNLKKFLDNKVVKIVK